MKTGLVASRCPKKWWVATLNGIPSKVFLMVQTGTSKQTNNSHVQCKDLDPTINRPFMMVIDELDRVLSPCMVVKIPAFVHAVQMHLVPGSGHWILQEKPKEYNQLLKSFFTKANPIANNEL
ncbi:hypothetical protein PS15p_209477 [Mucor circinelloides]